MGERSVLMHKTCIFTEPVFTDVNTRYAPLERGRQPDCITSAIYLFYPGGWIKLVYGIRACCVYARRKARNHTKRGFARITTTTPFDFREIKREREGKEKEDTLAISTLTS